MTTLSDNPIIAEILTLSDRELREWRRRLARNYDRADGPQRVHLTGFLSAISEEEAKRGLSPATDSRFSRPWDLEPEGEDDPGGWPEDDGLAWMSAPNTGPRDAKRGDFDSDLCTDCGLALDLCRGAYVTLPIEGEPRRVWRCGYELAAMREAA